MKELEALRILIVWLLNGHAISAADIEANAWLSRESKDFILRGDWNK